jgi:hypothetical protein
MLTLYGRHEEENQHTTLGLLQFGLDGISLNFLFANVLQLQLDVIKPNKQFLTSTCKSKPSSGYGLTNFKSPNCSKPCSLCGSLKDDTKPEKSS